jgi:hypothetical protein
MDGSSTKIQPIKPASYATIAIKGYINRNNNTVR